MNERRLREFEERRHELMAELAGEGVIVDVGYVNFPNPYLRGEVIGLDLHARECPPGYARVIEADALDMPLADGSVDAVVAGELLEHMLNPVRYLLECNRVLRAGGKCVFSVPNPYHLSEVVKNLTLSRRELFTNSHLVAPSYRLVAKLLSLCGFELRLCRGDYLRVPKLHWLVPMARLPGLAYRNIYAAEKAEAVTQADFDRKLVEIHHREAAQAARRPA